MNQRKILFPAIIIVLALITVALIISAVTTPTKNKAGLNPTPATKPYASLSFSPEKLSPTDTASQTADIVIDTNGKGVFGAQIELQYDPNIISNLTIDLPENSFFGKSSTELIKHVSQEEGRATFAVGVGPNDEEKKGRGTIATIKFQINPSSENKTEITILPISSINNLVDEGSVLLNSTTLPITFAR